VPVVLMASVHLSMTATSTLIRETVRAFLSGVGTDLLPGLERRANATVRVSNV